MILICFREEKLELNIRKKAILIPGFPSEDVIAEYLKPRQTEAIPLIAWNQPNLPNYLVSCLKHKCLLCQ